EHEPDAVEAWGRSSPALVAEDRDGADGVQRGELLLLPRAERIAPPVGAGGQQTEAARGAHEDLLRFLHHARPAEPRLDGALAAFGEATPEGRLGAQATDCGV